MNEQETKTIFAIIAGEYQNLFEVSKTRLNTWQAVLKDHDFETVHKALTIYLSESHQFPPKVGELNQIILNWNKKTSSEVWNEVLRLARCSSSLDKVNEFFKDDLSALKAINAIGWERIRYADLEKELPFIQKDFFRMYSENSKNEEVQRKVIGIEEAKQIANKFGLLTDKKLLVANG